MPGMRSVSFNLHNALTRWPASPFALSTLAVLIGLAYLYLLGDWRLAERGRRWPEQRTAAFLAGLVAVDAALQSPVATFTGSYFQAHVLQHLLLMVVAPPLLALGAPSTTPAADGQPQDQAPLVDHPALPALRRPHPPHFRCGSSTSGSCSPSS